MTGGSGWIGRATLRALEVQGHEGVPFDRSTHPEADVTDRDAVYESIGEVEHVIHLAGVLGTHELFRDPHVAVQVNVLGSLNVTKACAEWEVGLTEITMPRVNPSLYAATKACAMDIAEAYRECCGLRVSYVRAYNAYGPGQAYGGDHPQKIVPTFSRAAWLGLPLPVWGSGDLICDLVHVDDVARMLVEATAFGDGQVFDAGTGYRQTVMQVAEEVLDVAFRAGVRSKANSIDHLPPRRGERLRSTERDYAHGEGWELLRGWRPVFDLHRFREAVESYR